MVRDRYSNVFHLWKEEMGNISSERAAELLGKSLRMVQYYEEGREIPRDTLLLMDAYAQGFKPRHWRRREMATT